MAVMMNSPLPMPPQMKLPAAFQSQCFCKDGSTPRVRIWLAVDAAVGARSLDCGSGPSALP